MYFMDKRDFTVIENKAMTETEAKPQEKKLLHTNPIIKKMVKFHFDKVESFSVKDLFKK